MMNGTSEIDRTSTCPFLLRCFWNEGQHNHLRSYRGAGSGSFPDQEIQIYTWKDATLRELSDLLRDVIPATRRDQDKVMLFNNVFIDKNGDFQMRPVSR